MIDNPITTMDLLDRLTAALPFSARLTPELHASLRRQNLGGAIPTNCQVVLLHYMGDEGGILCKLDLRIPLILISHSGRSRSPIPVILIMLFTMPEEGTADSMTWRWTATTDG